MSHIIDRMNDAQERAKVARHLGKSTGPMRKDRKVRHDPGYVPDWQELLELSMRFALEALVNDINWEMFGGREGYADEIPF